MVIIIARPGFVNDDTNGSEAEIRPLVEWAIENNDKELTPVWEWSPKTGYVDYTIVNSGTIEDFYAKIDKLVPLIENYFAIVAMSEEFADTFS